MSSPISSGQAIYAAYQILICFFKKEWLNDHCTQPEVICQVQNKKSGEMLTFRILTYVAMHIKSEEA